jgi:ectoine hydroxylase-related dioxygenase (phytanoyl-CoA dioxygenase family)
MDGDFQTTGYQIARGLIDVSVIDQVRAILEDALEPTVRQMRALGIRTGTDDMVNDIRALLASPEADRIDRDLRVIMTGHYPLHVRLDPRLWIIAEQPRVQEFLASVLGNKSLRMHMPPTARFVWPGNADAGVPAHQDVTYNRHMSDFITFWVPLVPINDDCGGVTVFPGSDKAQLDTQMMDHGIWYDDVDTTGFEPLDCAPMAPGDVLIFNRFLAHKSMANTSNRIRFSMDYRFFPASERSEKHYLDMDQWKVIAPDE